MKLVPDKQCDPIKGSSKQTPLLLFKGRFTLIIGRGMRVALGNYSASRCSGANICPQGDTFETSVAAGQSEEGWERAPPPAIGQLGDKLWLGGWRRRWAMSGALHWFANNHRSLKGALYRMSFARQIHYTSVAAGLSKVHFIGWSKPIKYITQAAPLIYRRLISAYKWVIKWQEQPGQCE